MDRNAKNKLRENIARKVNSPYYHTNSEPSMFYFFSGNTGLRTAMDTDRRQSERLLSSRSPYQVILFIYITIRIVASEILHDSARCKYDES